MVRIERGSKFPAAVGPYSPASVAEPGRPIAFIAGQVASDESGELIGIGDFRAQFQGVMENLERALVALGAGFEDLAYVRGHLVRAEDYPVYTEERSRFYARVCPNGAPPTTTLIVASLYHPDCLLEIDAVAVLPGE